MHNDLTLAVMEETTVTLGKKLRAFSQTTCSAFSTKELNREYNSRIRREGKKQASAARTTTNTSSSTCQAAGSESLAQRLPPHGTNEPSAQVCASFSDYAQPERIHEGSSTHVRPVQPHSSIRTSDAAPGSQVGILPKGTGRRRKTLNLNTFKGHSAGDYVNTIREYGTCDSYSTEPVCYKFLESSA
jgi:hypothetical protein